MEKLLMVSYRMLFGLVLLLASFAIHSDSTSLRNKMGMYYLDTHTHTCHQLTTIKQSTPQSERSDDTAFR